MVKKKNENLFVTNASYAYVWTSYKMNRTQSAKVKPSSVKNGFALKADELTLTVEWNVSYKGSLVANWLKNELEKGLQRMLKIKIVLFKMMYTMLSSKGAQMVD